jgi:hypothetical protein
MLTLSSLASLCLVSHAFPLLQGLLKLTWMCVLSATPHEVPAVGHSAYMLCMDV